MKKLHLGLVAAAVVVAIVVFQYTRGAGTSGGNSQPGQDPQVPDLGATVSALIPTLEAARAQNELVVMVPSKAIEESKAILETKNIPLRVLRDQSRNPQYYVNQLIPHLRKQDSHSIWLVFDNREPRVVDPLTEFFLSTHRVTYEKKFEHLSLLRVVNELPSEASDIKQLGLSPVITRRGGTITNIVFTPSGDFMLLSAKHGVIKWRAMDSHKDGVCLQLPQSKKGSEGVFSGGESGLVGLALHPSFDTNRKLYLQYNYQLADGKRKAIVSEWELDEKLVAHNERVLLEIPQPRTDHNAGQLVFGPDDGYLYIAVGDGGEGKHTIGRAPAHTYRGKVLRIDVATRTGDKEYGIPADNPFTDHDELPPETYAWGFRNPWRMSFTPDGRLITGDIGEDLQEEITFVVAGRHHGWPYFEGDHPRNPWTLDDQKLQPTLLPYGRKHGMSVIGGFAYRGNSVESLKGKYVFADFISGRIWAMALPESTDRTLSLDDTIELGRWPLLFTTFGQDPQGNLYLGSNTGRLYRLDNPDSNAPPMEAADSELIDDSTAQAMFGTVFAGPTRNDATKAEITLGRALYTDTRLSHTGKTSCATCHSLDNFGQDSKRLSIMATGQSTRRNTPTTFNAHLQFAQLWDYRAETIEQVVTKMFVAEHGLEDEARVSSILQAIPEYVEMFAQAFPDGSNSITSKNAAQAIGGFVRQLTTKSRWDTYLDGDGSALTTAEKQGLSTFISVGCITCHQFRGLGGSMPHKLGLLKPWTGHDRGRAEVSEDGQDYYFKVPPLLNIEKTAPYLHDGSVKTLEESIRVMADIQLARKLTDAQTKSIATFLRALTGKTPTILE